jgi:outer membrane protein OmpA-like peptidoglycan-associated protein
MHSAAMAERTAPTPVRASVPAHVQRCGGVQCPPGSGDHDERQLDRSAGDVGPYRAPPLVREVLDTPGSPSDAGLRTDMERRLGHDLGAVRIHADTPSVVVGSASVQRACGWAEIGSVAGCAERGGDISEFGGSSEDVFLFVRDCDDLATGESDRLTGYAGRIRPGDEVDVDGFASEEGNAEFNRDLACSRANKAADLLSTAGARPRSLRLYSHGATAGDRPMHRSAVITVVPAPESPITAESRFHPGVMHDHQPSGRWADVQSSPNSGNKESLACAALPPAGVVAAAIQFEFGDKRTALEHLNWYLGNGGGADFDENDNLEAVLRTEPVVQARIRAHIPSGRRTGKAEFSFPLFQSDYVSQDFRFAFGAIDRMDVEIDLSAGTVHAWFMDRYEWHPVYPFYSHFADDVARSTNCVHAAMVELKAGGARDYWMKGEATVPLSVLGASAP